MDLHLRGKAVLLAGGTRGIGRATAELFVAEGASVVLTLDENIQYIAEQELAAREVDLIRVVGKTRPVRVYEILGEAVSPAAGEVERRNS